MIHLILPDNAGMAGAVAGKGGGTESVYSPHDLRVYLALEEWAARNLPADEYFFTWIVPPTVIIGRNQDLDKEVDVAYCRANGIDIVRRRSGGGCVYADLGNIMLSYITPGTDVAAVFARFTGMVAKQLRAMGIDAQPTGRNDIAVGGRKISGNAFYHLPGRSIVHGTMLYATDMTHMQKAITPSRAKLLSKGVKSVPMRIVTAGQLLPDLSLADFNRGLINGLTDGSRHLTDAEMAQVLEIAAAYADPKWLAGRAKSSRGTTYANTGRLDGVGELTATVALDDDGRIADIDLTGDFFMLADLDRALFDGLKGVPPVRAQIEAALPGADLSKAIAGLKAHDLARLLAKPGVPGGTAGA